VFLVQVGFHYEGGEMKNEMKKEKENKLYKVKEKKTCLTSLCCFPIGSLLFIINKLSNNKHKALFSMCVWQSV
jgi:hypothetical protein